MRMHEIVWRERCSEGGFADGNRGVDGRPICSCIDCGKRFVRLVEPSGSNACVVLVKKQRGDAVELSEDCVPAVTLVFDDDCDRLAVLGAMHGRNAVEVCRWLSTCCWTGGSRRWSSHVSVVKPGETQRLDVAKGKCAVLLFPVLGRDEGKAVLKAGSWSDQCMMLEAGRVFGWLSDFGTAELVSLVTDESWCEFVPRLKVDAWLKAREGILSVCDADRVSEKMRGSGGL